MKTLHIQHTKRTNVCVYRRHLYIYMSVCAVEQYEHVCSRVHREYRQYTVEHMCICVVMIRERGATIVSCIPFSRRAGGEIKQTENKKSTFETEQVVTGSFWLRLIPFQSQPIYKIYNLHYAKRDYQSRERVGGKLCVCMYQYIQEAAGNGKTD
jgi:hypothetical protein